MYVWKESKIGCENRASMHAMVFWSSLCRRRAMVNSMGRESSEIIREWVIDLCMCSSTSRSDRMAINPIIILLLTPKNGTDRAKCVRMSGIKDFIYLSIKNC